MCITMNVLNESGKCNVCSNDAQQECMQCLLCKKRYHVISCTTEPMMQTSFVRNTWPGMSTRWPCLNFVCLLCIEDAKSREQVDMSARVRVLEQTALETNNKLETITELLNTVLKRSQNGPDKESWADVAGKGNQPCPIIIDKPSDTETDEIRDNNIREVTEAAVQVKAGVIRSMVNNAGQTVIVCDSEKSKKALLPHVEKVFHERNIKTPNPRLPSITVPFIGKKYENEELLNVLARQNEDRGIIFSEENTKVLFSAPMKNKPGYFQAVLRVSEAIRDRIEANGNRLCIGLNSCPVYDRFFIKRCNRCQGLNHFQNDDGGCTRKKVCALCSGEHDTQGCITDKDHYRCINCVNTEKDEFSHSTFSPQCNTYIAEQAKLRKSINYYSKNT